ncbi:MAG: T9SS type A sorting domain-containing protein, partial [Lewinella sp.]|nr:T9SS type A sorting domain-containing protein [Lewinella sp.]
NIVCYLLLLALINGPLRAQSVAPGGVPGAVQWWATSTDGQGQAQWQDHLAGLAFPFTATAEPALTNYWPAPQWPAAGLPDQFPLPARAARQVTLFSVYRAVDPGEEQVVWTWYQDDQVRQVMTNYRLANLRDRTYLNYPDPPRHTHLSTYWQGEGSKAAVGIPALQLGQPPATVSLPATRWYGALPEMIAYDRFLAPEERQRVESYLAMKYGLTLRGLPDAPDYLNAAGQVVWAASEEPDFHHRVISLGRDDASGWQQTIATSAEMPELLTLATGPVAGNNLHHPATLPDQTFLILGDNDEPLDWQPLPVTTDQQRLARQWRVQATGETEALTTSVRFEVGRWQGQLAPGQTWWLAIDRSGTGDFSLDQTDYLPLPSSPNGRFITFPEVRWDTDGSGADQFTLVAGPTWLVHAELDLPTCAVTNPGSLRLQCQGGATPYFYTLQQRGGATLTGSLTEGASALLEGLSAGNYQLLLTDATGQQRAYQLELSAQDAPEAKIEATYELPATGEPLTLSPPLLTTDPEVQWAWEGPAGFQAGGPTVSLREAGAYTLRLNRDGCQRTYSFRVEAAAMPVLRVRLYPNPAAVGAPVQWQAFLPETGELEVNLFNARGQLLDRQTYWGDQYYAHDLQLREAGIYQLRFRSGDQILTQKLVIQ